MKKLIKTINEIGLKQIRICNKHGKNRLTTSTNQKAAFTLAEVLVTITVIGAIAAMTLPNLSNYYKRVEYSTKLKHFVSRMDNALQKMELEKGSFKRFEKNQVLGSWSKILNWYLAEIDPYVGHKYMNRSTRTFYFEDGSSLRLYYPGNCLDVLFDVNGKKKPNEIGRDEVYFLFCFTDADRTYNFGSSNVFFGSYGGVDKLATKSATRKATKERCKTSKQVCSRLLEIDGWEYKSDYPHKL